MSRNAFSFSGSAFIPTTSRLIRIGQILHRGERVNVLRAESITEHVIRFLG